MSINLLSYVDTIDTEIEKLARLIAKGAEFDRELAAGLGVSISIRSVQGDIDLASAAVEAVVKDFKLWERGADKPKTTTRTRS